MSECSRRRSFIVGDLVTCVPRCGGVIQTPETIGEVVRVGYGGMTSPGWYTVVWKSGPEQGHKLPYEAEDILPIGRSS